MITMHLYSCTHTAICGYLLSQMKTLPKWSFFPSYPRMWSQPYYKGENELALFLAQFFNQNTQIQSVTTWIWKLHATNSTMMLLLYTKFYLLAIIGHWIWYRPICTPSTREFLRVGEITILFAMPYGCLYWTCYAKL